MRKLKLVSDLIMPGAPAIPNSPAMTKVIIYCGKPRSPQQLTLIISEWISFSGGTWTLREARMGRWSKAWTCAGGKGEGPGRREATGRVGPSDGG